MLLRQARTGWGALRAFRDYGRLRRGRTRLLRRLVHDGASGPVSGCVCREQTSQFVFRDRYVYRPSLGGLALAQ
jgi:hypothetical protein